MRKIVYLLMMMILVSIVYAEVYPGAIGPGTDWSIFHAGAPTIYRVTELGTSSTRPGTLAYCVARSGPRICVFEISGYIEHKDNIIIRNPNLIIAGQTAPSPGITLKNTIE